jgi:hypothetical protein
MEEENDDHKHIQPPGKEPGSVTEKGKSKKRAGCLSGGRDSYVPGSTTG